ncbi:MAG: glycosyltransferase [Erysipelotrichales bacterium]|nr:glycosyltransferase [Erysipelotrichales bacterium]
MDTKKFRIQKIYDKAIICFTFVLLLYLLLSTISYNNTNIINAIIENALIVRILNATFTGVIGLFTVGWLILNKEHFKLLPTIVFVSLLGIYIIYYSILGGVSQTPLNETLSNIKNVLVIIVNMYFVLFVLSKIIKLKHIKIIYFGLLFLILFSFSYVIIIDYHNIIDILSNRQIYDFSDLSPFLNKNLIGAFVFLSALMSYYLYSFEKKKRYILLYIILFVPNIMSLCKTSIICMILLTIIILCYFKNKSIKRILFRIFLITLILVSVIFIVLILFEVIKPIGFESLVTKLRFSFFKTIAVRFALFTKSVYLLNYKNVWLGNGYASSLVYLNKIEGVYFHNSYVYLLNTGGIVLTILFIYVFYRIIANLRTIKKFNHYLYFSLFAIVLIYVFYAMFENLAFFSFTFISCIFTICLVITPEIFVNNLKIREKEEKVYKEIAFITTIYPTKNKKWYGIYLKYIAKSLKILGHKLNVIYIHEGDGDVHNSIYDGITITHIYYKPSFAHKLMISKGFKFKSDFEYIIKKYHFDDAIIHFYPPAFQNFMIKTLKEDGVKVLHYLHSRNIWRRVEEKRPIFRKLYYNRFYKSAYKKCDTIICVSKLVEDDFKVKLKNVHTQVVYNGVDNIFFNDTKNIKTMDDKQIKLISVGNLYSIKGHEYVLKALSTLVDKHKDLKFEYLIIGSGEQKNRLRQIVKESKLSHVVKFVKEMPQEKIKQSLLNYDIFILPSYYEALGCCYLEAMASGCYTIGCKHQGISEIITPCNGYLVDEYSSDDIVNIVEGIIRNSNNNSYIRRNAIKTAKQYTWMNCAIELSKYL